MPLLLHLLDLLGLLSPPKQLLLRVSEKAKDESKSSQVLGDYPSPVFLVWHAHLLQINDPWPERGRSLERSNNRSLCHEDHHSNFGLGLLCCVLQDVQVLLILKTGEASRQTRGYHYALVSTCGLVHIHHCLLWSYINLKVDLSSIQHSVQY